jgi:hypothetical protein
MRNIKTPGILAVMLVFGLLVVGCSNNGTLAEIKALPSYEGEFVASEDEATDLALGAETQIMLAINAALANGGASPNILPHMAGDIPPQLDIQAARAATSGHYSYMGISLDYTITTSANYPTPPASAEIVEKVTIDGTYGGYKINGIYDLTLSWKYTSASDYTVKYGYNCIYTVSHAGKGIGMKVVQTGNMTMTSAGKITYALHYTVYDNGNVGRYSYDYKGSL